MRTFIQKRSMQMCAVLALAGLMILVSPATAAYNQRNTQQDQAFTEQQEQESENVTGEDIDRPDTDRDRQGQAWQSQRDRDTAGAGAARNLQLERQIASQLRSQGYGQAGQIMILATGNRVILLGNVPDKDMKKGAADIAKQAARGARVDDRLHVVEEPKQMSDTQLQAKVTDKLSGDAAKAVRVQAQNGTVVLQGQLNTWTQAADAIDAAFAAGAQKVNSQITVGTATAQAGGAAGGYYPSYGYTPGTSGQQGAAGGGWGRQGAMSGRAQAMASDLRLAQQVAQQLQQQLPPGQNVETIQPQSIYVMVQQGTVTLHGYVMNTNQKQQAEQIVRSVQGVQNINNDLAIWSSQGGMAGQGQGRWQQGGAGGQSQYGQGDMSGQSQYGQSGMSGQSQWGQGSQGMSGQQMTTSDRRLAQTIQQQLQSQFPGSNINVRSSQGTVTLQGTVPDANLKQQAEQFAYSIPGVQNVQNNLTVSGQGGTAGQGGYYPPQGYIPGQQLQQGMSGQTSGQRSYGDTTPGPSGMSGQSGMSSQSQFGPSGQQSFGGGATGGQMAMSQSDMAIARQVVQKLQQQLGSGIRTVRLIRPGTIYVMAKQGTVMLHGFGVNQSVTQQVNQIARSIPGVRNVQSMLNTGAGAAGGFYPSYGYVPGQGQMDQQGQMGQQGQRDQTGRQGQPGTGMSGSTNQNRSRQNTSGAQFSQSAYSNQSSMGGRNTGAGDKSSQAMGGHSMQPLSTSPSDTALAQQVAQKLQQQLPGQKVQVLRPDTIYIQANQGTVTLHGFISDPSMKQRISQVAQSISGVTSVKNFLGSVSGAGASSALGYIPGQEDQSDTQQFGTDQPDTEGYMDEDFESTESFEGQDSAPDESDTSSGTY